jgi:Spy/CpxP family protein refolding chaperone
MRIVRVFALAAAFLFLPLLAASAQDKKDTPKETPKGRALPTHWGKLGLTDEQKSKVYSITGEYKTQIDDLQKQINALKKKEREALDGVLTDAQKAVLKEMILNSVPGAGTKPPKDSKSDK